MRPSDENGGPDAETDSPFGSPLAVNALVDEVHGLRARLAEAEEVIRAIRHDEVDAVVVGGPEPERVYVFEGADHPYRMLVETMREGAVTLGGDGTVLFANPAFVRLVRASIEDVIGTSFDQYVTPADHDRFDALLNLEGAGKDEVTLLTTDGTEVPAYLSRSAAEFGRSRACVLTVTDLTEQQRHAEIVASERLVRSILDQAAGAIVVCDLEGRITHASRVAGEACGVSNPLLRPFEEAFPLAVGDGFDDDPETFTGRVARGITPASRVEVACRREQGDAHFLLSSAPLFGDNGQVRGTILVLTDITQRKRALEALRQSELMLRNANESLETRVGARTRQVRALASALALAEQAERQRLASVLHDDLQQMLFGLRIKLELAAGAGSAPTPDRMATLASEMRAITDDAIRCTRNLSIELSPPVLRGEDLAASLAWLGDHMEESYGLEVSIDAAEPIPSVSEGLHVLLFQVVRELLFNVVKHAAVKSARVELTAEGDVVVLVVEDRGAGFDTENAARQQPLVGGLGLHSVSHRLELLGGHLDISSRPGTGTRVTAVAPLLYDVPPRGNGAARDN